MMTVISRKQHKQRQNKRHFPPPPISTALSCTPPITCTELTPTCRAAPTVPAARRPSLSPAEAQPAPRQVLSHSATATAPPTAFDPAMASTSGEMMQAASHLVALKRPRRLSVRAYVWRHSFVKQQQHDDVINQINQSMSRLHCRCIMHGIHTCLHCRPLIRRVPPACRAPVTPMRRETIAVRCLSLSRASIPAAAAPIPPRERCHVTALSIFPLPRLRTHQHGPPRYANSSPCSCDDAIILQRRMSETSYLILMTTEMVGGSPDRRRTSYSLYEEVDAGDGTSVQAQASVQSHNSDTTVHASAPSRPADENVQKSGMTHMYCSYCVINGSTRCAGRG